MTKPAHPSFNLGTLIAVASLCLGVLSACGVQETAQSRAVEASPQAAATTTLVPYEATQESRRATSMARVANDIATSEALPTPEVWPTLPPNPTYDPNLNPRGIVSCEPVQWDQLLIENCWAEEINGVRVGVRAGALLTDIEQGALQLQDEGYINVRRQSLESGSSTWEEEYLTPTEAGRIEVVAANDFVLTLRAENGRFFAFDLDSREWITPPATATPVPATPASTTTPSPTPVRRARADALLAGIPADPAARAQTRERAALLAKVL